MRGLSASRTPSSERRKGSPIPVLLAALLVAGCVAGTTPTPGPTSPPVATPIPTQAPTPSPTPVQPDFPLTLTDDEGTKVAIPAAPQRIVSLSPANTEILWTLGAGARQAGGTDYDDFPADAVALPDVASYTGVDVEKIVGLEADLVLATGKGFNPPDDVARLRSLGIPVLVVYAPDVDGVLADIELIGTAIGEREAALALTAAMRSEMERVRTAAQAAGTTPRVFYELDATAEIYGPADDSFVAEMVVLAGGEPITTGDPNVFAISLERLVDADPEVIVLGDANYGATPEGVAQRPGWGTMTAVKAGAIRPVDDIVVTRPGPRLAEGLLALARAIHPELDL